MGSNGAGGRLRRHRSGRTKAGRHVRTSESNTHSASVQRSRSEGRNKGDMTKVSYYQRVLPSPPAIDFASNEGKKLFHEALLAGTMVGFFMLMPYFQTQSEPAYCGLASLSMVLNALAIDPGRTWKGPWRWYDESMLGCPKELKKIKAEGISFGNAVHWARRAGAEVEAFQTSQKDVHFFRQSVKKCCSSDNCHLVSSYHRADLKQAGTGHFSPIGGYHGKCDMVLILDVARFKYRCHWAPLPILWKAMDTVDETTGQRRGFMLISKPKRDAGLLCTLSCENENWVGVVKYLMDDVPHLLKSKDVKDINGILSILLASPPSGFGKFIQSAAEVKREQECGIGISEEEKQRLASREELLKQVRDTGFFEYIVNFLPSTSCCSRVPVFGGSENLDEIAAGVCCHGAEILSGKSGTSGCSCCHETCVKCMKADGHKTSMVPSATIVKGTNEEEVNMLVPQSLMKLSSGAPGPNNCTSTRLVGSNFLTLLLLMLPPETWCGIKDEKLREEVQGLVSMDNLPDMLKRELFNLKKGQENITNKKCAEEISFLGHIDGGERVQMDKANICGFIRNYLSITMPLTDMPKKLWKSTDRCQKTFDQLKQSMTNEPMPDEHLVAFESLKLKNARQCLTVQEKVDPNSATDVLSHKIMEPANTVSQLHCHRIKKGLKHDQRAQNLIGSNLIEDQPQMQDNLEACVKTSLVCQQEKLGQQSSSGLLEPLLIPTYPWEGVSMNFIMNLPKSKGHWTLMVVVDRFSKYAIFVPMTKDCPAEKKVKLFLKHVVKIWGVPKMIVSDCDPQLEHFWKLLGLELNLSISQHSQTDYQTERINALLEIYFRHYVSTRQMNWKELIDIAHFSYNSWQSEFTCQSPFEIINKQQLRTPSVVALGYQGSCPSTWQEQVNLVQANLHKALEHMKKWADMERRHVEFQVEDSVWIKQYMILKKKDVHKGLKPCYMGPFKVLRRVGKVAYELVLPPKLKLHPVFHVSMLYSQVDKEDPDRDESQ